MPLSAMPFRLAMVAVTFACMTLSASAKAASFDCSKARSYSEKAVCNDPHLSALDDTLGATYAKAYAASVDKSAMAAAREQEWRWRQRHCHDAICVEDWYTRRIAEVAADSSASDHSSERPPLPVYRDSPSMPVAQVGNSVDTPAPAVASVTTVGQDTAPQVSASGAANTSTVISWVLPAAATSWSYPPLPALSSHSPVDSRRIRPLGPTQSVSTRTIGVFVGF